MRTSQRKFLKAAGSMAPALEQFSQGEFSAFNIAQRHTFVRDLPTPNFFEGMLLGNGDIGVCVTVRPDALGLHMGKEDSWDIRVSKDHIQHLLKFREVKKLWERGSAEAKRQGQPDLLHLEANIDFFRDYTKKVWSSYGKPWPRPWPCGIVWIHWDTRMVQVERQTLDPSNGLYQVELKYDDLQGKQSRFKLSCFVSWHNGHIAVASDGPTPILSVAYYPHVDANARLPSPEVETSSGVEGAEFFCTQQFPALAPTAEQPDPSPSPEDRNFALCGRLQGKWKKVTQRIQRPNCCLKSDRPQPFRLDITLFTPRDKPDNVTHARRETAQLSTQPFAELQKESERGWREFWSRSAVEFADKELERVWYHNQYFLPCCLKAGKVAPGLFGNWISGKIGTAWHGDYHMNYNTQQVFWGLFSSNHAEQHLPYVELCENLLPMAEAFARDHFELPGAFFPHSAYPVPSKVNPYPVPPWGYEVCETPWTVQSLWWHYLYTLDRGFLKRVYPLLRAASRFLVAYVTKGSDGRYHIVPTVSPENWGCTVNYRLNRDCIMDLALSEFVLKATAEAAHVLEVDETERKQWLEVGSQLAEYPKAQGPFGEVWLDVVDAPVEYVYNIPVTLAPVFPGEQVGLDKREELLSIACCTAKTVRCEGGNDLVYLPLILARLGILDLTWFKCEVRYCLLPNGVANDRVRQIGGRYNDWTDFDFMMHLGVWMENLSLPAVLNECLLQSYTGTLRLFPNTKNLGPARFQNLRAVGAFLVSAAWDGRRVSGVKIFSEKGTMLWMVNPWGSRRVTVTETPGNRPVRVSYQGDVVQFATKANYTYLVATL